MKVRTTLSLEDTFVQQMRDHLAGPPKKSLSTWVDEQMHKYLQELKEKS